MPRGRARSEFRLNARSAGVGILPHTLSMKCGDRGHTLAERMQFLSLSLLHESSTHSPPTLSPHWLYCVWLLISAYAYTSCFTCAVHPWSGQCCVCLSGDPALKQDKYMKPLLLPQTLVSRLAILWGSYLHPRLGHRMVTYVLRRDKAEVWGPP